MKKKLFLYSLFFTTFTTVAFASEDAGLEDYLCNVFLFLTGNVGKALAAFTCIGISLTFIAGKIAWTTVLTFAIGMACIFGAPQIVKAFAGGEIACKGKTVFDGN